MPICKIILVPFEEFTIWPDSIETSIETINAMEERPFRRIVMDGSCLRDASHWASYYSNVKGVYTGGTVLFAAISNLL